MTMGSRITQKINPIIKTHPVQQSKRGKNVAMVKQRIVWGAKVKEKGMRKAVREHESPDQTAAICRGYGKV